jgi:hypothetical protein
MQIGALEETKKRRTPAGRGMIRGKFETSYMGLGRSGDERPVVAVRTGADRCAEQERLPIRFASAP